MDGMNVVIAVSIELVSDEAMDSLSKDLAKQMARHRVQDPIPAIEVKGGMAELPDFFPIGGKGGLSERLLASWLADRIVLATEGEYPKTISLAQVRHRAS
jgi:hypothetical protein